MEKIYEHEFEIKLVLDNLIELVIKNIEDNEINKSKF